MTQPLSALLAPIGWSQRELARRVPCSESTVRRWEDDPPDRIVEWLVEVADAIAQHPPPVKGWGR